jgi:membrane protein YdbS with pleckstrin-like domain
MTILIVLLALYLVLTFVTAWIMSDGFTLDFSIGALSVLALMWPIFIIMIVVSYYEEWRYKTRKLRY